MTYIALARKYRPKTFAEVVGQEHVVSAISNSLDSGRMHHAYLLSGTRGVGKTTLARLLAKSLNCEKGESSKPCGTCASCAAVDEGRFVDLIEVDAASRTKVDDTRELLDNVQYAPTIGRYKVYLIDEVHMLSGHSFNALLKTLEEPPPHVKFLLATTDPQKLPVTILSRCLQFNLKVLRVEQIEQQFQHILSCEEITCENTALTLLSRAAAGSMRDGLSLLDQAIAHGDGSVMEANVRDMLGLIDANRIPQLLSALESGACADMLQVVAAVAESGGNYSSILDDLMLAIHQISVKRLTGVDTDNSFTLESEFNGISDEDLQLYYQIAVLGKRDLPLAPDPRTGLEMVLLRMSVFRPEPDVNFQPPPGGDRQERFNDEEIQAPPGSKSGSRGAPASAGGSDRISEIISAPAEVGRSGVDQAQSRDSEKPHSARQAKVLPGGLDVPTWYQIEAELDLKGVLGELAANMVPESDESHRIRFSVQKGMEQYATSARMEKLAGLVSESIGRTVRIDVADDSPVIQTPAQRRAQLSSEAHRAMVEEAGNNPVVKAITEKFNGSIIEQSVEMTPIQEN